MRVAVLGAGIIGVTTAWELAADGHEVVVVDRRDEPASETSYANAGMIAPGHAYAWSSPKTFTLFLRALFRDDLALRFRFQRDPNFWRWAVKFARQCTTERAARTTARKVGLSLYSQRCLHALLAETGIECGRRSGGALYLHRSPEGLEQADANARIIREVGVELRRLGPDELAAIDPVYEPMRDRFAGALFAPGDESGDARQFTRALARSCAERGVEFRFGESIVAIDTSGHRIDGVRMSDAALAADAYVMALGSYSSMVARRIGLDLPIYPVKGYSVTLPIEERDNPPTLSGMDEDNLFAFANYGDRVRFTAIAELAGYDWSHEPDDFNTILDSAHQLFPDAGNYDRPAYWAGLRPMTPDNLPIIGRRRFENLWINSGHGQNGWAWACGSARIAADLIAARTPEHELQG